MCEEFLTSMDVRILDQSNLSQNSRKYLCCFKIRRLELATGEFIALLDHDDELPEQRAVHDCRGVECASQADSNLQR
jgi:hypothetical protein